MQDPGPLLAALGVRLPCPVSPRRAAILDRAHEARVNHEVYFFSSPEARAAFRRDPLRYCGTVTDPVSGARFRPRGGSARLVHDGRPYYFASPGTRARFQRDPGRFAEPARTMGP